MILLFPIAFALGFVGLKLMKKSFEFGYRQGKKILVFLSEVDEAGHKLRSDAAQAFELMRGAAALQGVTIEFNPGRTAFRGAGDQAAIEKQKGSYGSGGNAAKPGFSRHEEGIAADLNVSDPKVERWLVANSKQFGWSPVGKYYTLKPEPWHYEFTG